MLDIRNPGPLVNSPHWDTQPSLTADGRTLYFASNRPGGSGGTDIWTTTLDDRGRWSEARPLGPAVNTDGDERSPSIAPDGTALYFASNGFSGYGAMDIWMAAADETGWSPPQNLGPEINSSGNDLFFHMHGADRRFYFASDRDGGLGGLDLFMGTPDIFSAGFFYLTVRVIDSTSGNPLPSSVSVLDVEQDRIVLSWDTDTQTDFYTQQLPAGREYLVRVTAGSDQKAEIRINRPPSGRKEQATFRFGLLTAAEFDLGRYNVPFFVSGYYRPNTPAELEQMLDRRKGILRGATYIESFARNSTRHRQYSAYAATVETIFESVRLEAVNNVFPRLGKANHANDTVLIILTGYADPHPIIGRYVEDEEVRFEDERGQEHTLERGDMMTNLALSGLRAWHSARHLDRLFRASDHGGEAYRQLSDAGRIQYRIVGGDVQRDTRNYDVQRRIHIRMEFSGLRTRGADESDSFDLNESLREKQDR